MKIAPGLSLNLSKSGASLSFGPRGAKVTVGPKGVRKTVGLPGTGLYYTKQTGYGKSRQPVYRQAQRSRKSPLPVPTVRPADQLNLGFFKRLVTPQSEEEFVDGMRAFVSGKETAAYRLFGKADHLADAAFMAGILALKRQQFDKAEGFLLAAKRNRSRLGRYFAKYGIGASAVLAITDEVSAVISPDRRGLLLALAEVHQHQHKLKETADDLKQLYRHDRSDVLVRLSLAELLVEDFGKKRNCQTVVRLAEGIKNDSEVHAALLLYKAKALRKLGLLTAARDTLTATLRRKKNRSAELLRALRYERILVYNELGEPKRMRKELEKLYAEAPDYEDVAKRLGLDNPLLN